MKIIGLAGLFFVTACLYASVGFGGGSTYTALLAISGTDYHLIPVIALICNILVVSGNVTRYTRAGLLDFGRILPLIIFSVPAAWLGGRLEISETVFIGLLWAALLIASVRLLFGKKPQTEITTSNNKYNFMNACIGGFIGFYSGLVGIGGGIFLAPILHFMRWGTALQIAATCSLFILVNSLSGIWGQMTKLDNLARLGDITPYWPLFPAVILGGLIGNFIGVTRLSDTLLKRLTGALILVVALRLAWRWLNLML